MDECKLTILEQPADHFRFRYMSEMHATHGSLFGCRSQRSKRTFPEVQLQNYNGSAIIRCSLCQVDTPKPMAHPHLLIINNDGKHINDPHDVHVSPESGYIARFENMCIINTPKKNVCYELIKKKRVRLKVELQGSELSKDQEHALYAATSKESGSINPNKVCLCFEAFKVNENGSWTPICEPVFSKPIKNRKSSLTNELKICRISSIVGSVLGKDDLILLTEKVCKNDIRVRFFEVDCDEEVWEAFGYFSEADVHHQYAIAVKTPPYRDVQIEDCVNVYIELIRSNDGARSLPVSFRYRPQESVLSKKRRQRIQMSQLSAGTKRVNRFLSKGPTFELLYKQFLKKIENEKAYLKRLHSPERSQTDDAQTDQLRLPHVISRIDEAFRQRFEQGLKKTINRILQINEDYVAGNKAKNTIIHELIAQYNYTGLKQCFNTFSKLDLPNLLNETNESSQTPLHLACKLGQHTVVSDPIRLNCKTNIQDIDGNTALHYALAHDNEGCVEILLSCPKNEEGMGINVNLTNKEGYTPLHLAIRKHKAYYVELLLTSNASVKLTDKHGNNTLHIAVQEQQENIVKYILQRSNVRLDATNQAGLTVIDLAQVQGNQTIIDLLLMEPLSPFEYCIKEEGYSSVPADTSHPSLEIKIEIDNQ